MESIIIIIITISAVVLTYFVKTYNAFKSMREQIKQEKSGIETVLEERFNIVTQLQQIIKGEMKHESETLVKINAVRSGMSIDEMNKAERQMNSAVRQVYAVMEHNPKLQTHRSFAKIQETIRECEANIQAARRIYNASAGIFNSNIDMFPGCIVANIMRLGKVEYFQTEEEKKKLVDIQF